MARNPLKRILKSEDKGMGKAYGSNGFLTRFWCRMLMDLNISPGRAVDLMNDYVRDARNGIPQTRKDHTTARGNLTKEFARPQMTWKVFIKSLRFLQVEKAEFAIKCHYANGRTSIHGDVIDLGKRHQDVLFLDELETDDREISADEAERAFYAFLTSGVMFPFECLAEAAPDNR